VIGHVRVTARAPEPANRMRFTTVITWARFTDAAPDLAAFGKERLQGRIAYLATSRADGSPRVHPVSPFIARGRLFVYMEPTSPKGRDLKRDGRYAMHCSVEDNSGGGGEFYVSGRAEEVKDEEGRAKAFEGARGIGYQPEERYVVFELGVERAMSTVYKDGKAERVRWPEPAI